MKQHTMKPSDRYLKVVEWSEEDGCYVGTCPGLLHGGIHGDDERKVYDELCDAVEEAIDLLDADGRPLPPATADRHYSGRFVMRVDPELHKLLAIKAAKDGESLNALCEHALRDAVAAKRQHAVGGRR